MGPDVLQATPYPPPDPRGSASLYEFESYEHSVCTLDWGRHGENHHKHLRLLSIAK